MRSRFNKIRSMMNTGLIPHNVAHYLLRREKRGNSAQGDASIAGFTPPLARAETKGEIKVSSIASRGGLQFSPRVIIWNLEVIGEFDWKAYVAMRERTDYGSKGWDPAKWIKNIREGAHPALEMLIKQGWKNVLAHHRIGHEEALKHAAKDAGMDHQFIGFEERPFFDSFFAKSTVFDPNTQAISVGKILKTYRVSPEEAQTNLLVVGSDLSQIPQENTVFILVKDKEVPIKAITGMISGLEMVGKGSFIKGFQYYELFPPTSPDRKVAYEFSRVNDTPVITLKIARFVNNPIICWYSQGAIGDFEREETKLRPKIIATLRNLKERGVINLEVCSRDIWDRTEEKEISKWTYDKYLMIDPNKERISFQSLLGYFRFNLEEAQKRIIVIGTKKEEYHGLDGVVFISLGENSHLSAEALEEIIDKLYEKGEGNFKEGFERLWEEGVSKDRWVTKYTLFERRKIDFKLFKSGSEYVIYDISPV